MRGLIFDLDGTLVDSYAAIGISLNHARAAFGLDPMDLAEVRRKVGHGLESLIEDLVGPDRVAEGVRLFRERYAEVFAEHTFALPGVGDALATLADRGYPMTVASNKPARFSEPILDSLGFLGFFRLVEGPDRAGTTKPDPAMLNNCLRAMELDPRAALYVGDMVLDLQTGRCAGVPVVLIRGGSSSDEVLDATGLVVLDSMDRLPPFVGA